MSIFTLPDVVAAQRSAVTLQCQAPNRDSPIEQEPREDTRRPVRHLKLASAAHSFSPKKKSLFILNNH
jgi:hypothetical protein